MDELVFRLLEKKWMSIYMYTGPTLPPEATSHLLPAAEASLYSWSVPVQLNPTYCVQGRDFRGKSTWVFAVMDELLSRVIHRGDEGLLLSSPCIRQDFLKRRPFTP